MFRSKNVVQNTEKENQRSFPLEKCLAKTYTSPDGLKRPGRTVLDHCLIVGAVARGIITRMPHWLRENLFPLGSEFIAAAHDIGKVSPTFQEKIYRGADINYIPNSESGLEQAKPELEKHWGGHAGVSQSTTQFCAVGEYIPEILGQHHGYSPNLSGYLASCEQFGGHSWQEQRKELIIKLQKALHCDWPKVQSPLHARVLSGLTTVSDWIGSGSLFENPNDVWDSSYIEEALDSAGFVQPELLRDLSFKDIFGFELYNRLGLILTLARKAAR